jgi:DNA-binding PadR family transcriptional regulator
MERKLLLLGLLRWQEMHGYQLNEFIETHLGTSIELKKPTVYKLLGLMVDDGWIDYHEEKQGNYPTRRVYRITAEGEEAFQDLLRQNLATYAPISYLGNIGIVYLEALPGEEAADLLQERRTKVAGLRQKLHDDEDHQDGFQMMLSYHLGHLDAELKWLDDVIAYLEQKQTVRN